MSKQAYLVITSALLLAVLVAACGPAAPAAAPTVTPNPATEAAPPTVEPETQASAPESTPVPPTPTESALTLTLEPTTPPPTPTEPAPTLTQEPSPTAAATLPPAVTPSPEQKLLGGFVAAPEIDGEVLYLLGQVMDIQGEPLPGATVEIWQTDASGVYDHPGDPGTESRDRTFQFFGSSVADADGWYAFRTLMPGRYEPRPRHIHFKVKQDGATLLTSQFYFSDDIAIVEGEGMFQAVGESGDALLLQLMQGEDGVLANGPIVVDTGLGSGELALTPSQAEGPYYPVVSPSDFDNDLLTVP
jgi:protocatechuate 3,4-dioxygenase beta subunit